MGRAVSADLVTEYIRYRIDDDRRADFEEAYVAAAEVLAQSPHCVDYDLAASVEEPGCYILRIRWTSAEDHLEGFRTGELFPRFFASIKLRGRGGGGFPTGMLLQITAAQPGPRNLVVNAD